MTYDAILVVSFGGPEKREDVLPFLENVTRGRGVPRERLLEVAEHYYHFDGKSPINEQNRALIDALRRELAAHSVNLPIYWGNRNWHPLLAETLRQMRTDGVRRALAFVTSAYSSYSGCRQYRENLAAAQIETGEGAPEIDKLRVFYNHPGFIEACAERVREALSQFSPDERANLHFVATAHSIPCSMAASSAYETQLAETMRLIAEATGCENWQLVYQSRSGAPGQPWLEPDILDYLRKLGEQGAKNVLVAPIGFISDHLEVLYDLDVEARELAGELGIKLVRAATAGTHPAFITAIRELIEERLSGNAPRRAIGRFGPNHDVCPRDCCPAPRRPGTPAASEVPAVSQQP
ncbi:MAG TPA: ferrochelatase [Bryobacteraceae bacterium]|jgi:ferrochelatase|nr:ferrochelatase [Bryobacteraceae bacterium]